MLRDYCRDPCLASQRAGLCYTVGWTVYGLSMVKGFAMSQLLHKGLDCDTQSAGLCMGVNGTI